MLIGGSRREQVLFAGVMKELLAPINNPRYVIIGKEWGVRAYCAVSYTHLTLPTT